MIQVLLHGGAADDRLVSLMKREQVPMNDRAQAVISGHSLTISDMRVTVFAAPLYPTTDCSLPQAPQNGN